MPRLYRQQKDLTERIRVRQDCGGWLVEKVVWHEPSNDEPGGWRPKLIAAALREQDAEEIARKQLEVMRWEAERKKERQRSTCGATANGGCSRPAATRQPRNGSRPGCEAAATTPNGSAGEADRVYLARMGLDGWWTVQERLKGRKTTTTIAKQLSETTARAKVAELNAGVGHTPERRKLVDRIRDGAIVCLLGCGRVQRFRGQCQACYQRTLQDVHAGATTWEAEERAGRALPSGNPRAKRRA